jgi:hypothetical protein
VPSKQQGRGFRLAAFALAFAIALSGFYASARSANPDQPKTPDTTPKRVSGDDLTSGILTDVPMRGIVFDGLKRAAKKSRCRQGFVGRTADGKKICTHGPDAAPEGIDVRDKPHASELQAQEQAEAIGTKALPCYGDGQSGNRVQAIYAHVAGASDRSSQVIPLISSWAANVDNAFNESARQTGGVRHVLWATNSNCSLVVESVELSASGDDSLTNTINELKAKGYTRTDRKYLVWADATRYCGISEVLPDDKQGADNGNNFGPTFSRVDSACWGLNNSTEAHELMHSLGGIQPSAPHASGGWHCTDENDRMCLNDGMGKTLTYTCPASNEAFFDCGHDDYFTTASSPGDYLSHHWNTADSSFLSQATPDACTTSQSTTAQEAQEKRKRRHRHRRRPPAPTPTPAPIGAPPTTSCSVSQAFPGT